jgi:tetratricopeptide (TPR) repeat protein
LRAIELDPNLVDAQVEYARTLAFEGQWASADDTLAKALARDENHPDVLELYSGLLLGAGRLKEGLTIKQKLHELEPYVPLYIGNLATALWLNGRTEAAISLWTANLDRQGAGSQIGLTEIYAAQGEYSRAVDMMVSMVGQARYTQYLDILTAGIELMRSAPARVADPQTLPRLAEASFIYLHIGAVERVLDLHEEGQRGVMEVANLWHASYAPVRRTERFKTLMRNLGIVAYWRVKGWPEFCRPTTGDDFECI